MEYFGLVIMSLVGAFCFAVLGVDKYSENKKPYVERSMTAPFYVDMVPRTNEVWKNNFDDKKIKIVYRTLKWQGDEGISMINFVKEGEEGVLTCPEHIFIEQYTRISRTEWE